jgi:hypothetical protein
MTRGETSIGKWLAIALLTRRDRYPDRIAADDIRSSYFRT